MLFIGLLHIEVISGDQYTVYIWADCYPSKKNRIMSEYLAVNVYLWRNQQQSDSTRPSWSWSRHSCIYFYILVTGYEIMAQKYILHYLIIPS